MKGLFAEKMEYLKAKYNSYEGIFEWLLGSFFWGYIIVNFKDNIFDFILDVLSFLPEGLLQSYLAYLLFGVVLLPLGIIITYVLTKLYKSIFKTNGKVF